MRHDYHLPAGWDGMTDEERVEWFERERVRRQALQQDTNWAAKARRAARRAASRARARNDTTDIER